MSRYFPKWLGSWHSYCVWQVGNLKEKYRRCSTGDYGRYAIHADLRWHWKERHNAPANWPHP